MLEDWPEAVETEEEVRAVPPKGLEGDLGELLVDWLQELLYVFETRRLVPLGTISSRWGRGRSGPTSGSASSRRAATARASKSRP